MNKYIFPLILSLFLTSFSYTNAEKPSFHSPIIPSGLGYNIHFTDAKPGEMEMLADSGASIIRMDFGWNSTERTKGVYDFSAFERLTNNLEKHKITPLYILDYSNRNYDEGLSPYSEEGRKAFAKWAATAAVHFKGRGIIWEMYNEPNIHFWKPKPDPEKYILLALETGKAIREVAPDEIYIGPATSEIDLDFLEKCFKGGLLEYWDAVSVHPYRQKNPETAIPEYAKLRYMIDKYKPNGKNIPILSAEWGYSSAWNKYNDVIQGKMLPRQWMTNLACEVPISIWYDWHDDGTDPKEPEHHFGTTNNEYRRDKTPVYEPKPSYIAAKTFIETFRGYKYDKRIWLDNEEVFVFLLKKENDVKLAAWTTEKESKSIVIPCSPGQFSALSYLGEKLNDYEANENGLEITIFDGPIYLTPQNGNEILTDFAKERQTLQIVWYFSINDPSIVQKFPKLMTASDLSLQKTNPVGFDLEISFDKNGKTLTQYSVAIPASPQIIGAAYPDKDGLALFIENPWGESFSGKVELKCEDGLVSQNEQNVKFGEDEKNKTVRFAYGPKGVDAKEFNITANLCDDDGNPASIGREQTVKIFADFGNNWRVYPDGDSKVDSEQTLEISSEGAAKITYKFDDGWKFLNFAPLSNELRKVEGKPQSCTLRIDADGSGNSVRIRFSDSKGQTFQSDGGRMSEKGTMFFTCRMDGVNTAHWGGPDDGVVYYPIRFESIVIDGTRTATGPHTIKISPPVLAY